MFRHNQCAKMNTNNQWITVSLLSAIVRLDFEIEVLRCNLWCVIWSMMINANNQTVFALKNGKHLFRNLHLNWSDVEYLQLIYKHLKYNNVLILSTALRYQIDWKFFHFIKLVRLWEPHLITRSEVWYRFGVMKWDEYQS